MAASKTSKTATKSKPATKTATTEKKAPAKKPPVAVNNHTVRSDADVLEGHRCEVTAGEHKGLVGTFISVTEHGTDGYPLWVVVRSLQSHGSAELVSVQYKDIRPVDPAQS